MIFIVRKEATARLKSVGIAASQFGN